MKLAFFRTSFCLSVCTIWVHLLGWFGNEYDVQTYSVYLMDLLSEALAPFLCAETLKPIQIRVGHI